MKLLTWNCQGKFRQKYALIAPFAPDIAVIQECEHPDRLKYKGDVPRPTTQLWFGDKLARGLGIFSWSGWQFELYEGYDPSIQHCIPLRITWPLRANLLAVWAKPDSTRQFSYVGQVYRALLAYNDWLLSSPYNLVLGDFNSRVQLEGLPRMGGRSSAVQQLASLAISSAYHRFYREKQGSESRSTFYMQRHLHQPFHIDFVFIPNPWIYNIKNVTVGEPETWLAHSDHCPVMVEIAE